MNKESFNLLTDLINEKSKEVASKFSEIIENELKTVCEEYGISKDKIILQYYPEGNYSIAIKVNEFKISHEFTYKQPKETEQ